MQRWKTDKPLHDADVLGGLRALLDAAVRPQRQPFALQCIASGLKRGIDAAAVRSSFARSCEGWAM